MKIAVYLGSSQGKSPVFGEAARNLGIWIAGRGDGLVYGGSRTGLMGMLAEGALSGGGEVIGVEPRLFVEKNFHHTGITKLYVTDSLSERRLRMIELSDAFIAFPGGTGTLDEISEVLCLSALGHLTGPCIFYDLDGYYEDIRRLLEKMKQNGFSSERRLKDVYFAPDLDAIGRILDTYSFQNKKE